MTRSITTKNDEITERTWILFKISHSRNNKIRYKSTMNDTIQRCENIIQNLTQFWHSNVTKYDAIIQGEMTWLWSLMVGIFCGCSQNPPFSPSSGLKSLSDIMAIILRHTIPSFATENHCPAESSCDTGNGVPIPLQGMIPSLHAACVPFWIIS